MKLKTSAKSVWKSEWNRFAISEIYVTNQVRKSIKAKTFPVFLQKLVNLFGAFDEDCAKFLWEKLRKG